MSKPVEPKSKINPQMEEWFNILRQSSLKYKLLSAPVKTRLLVSLYDRSQFDLAQEIIEGRLGGKIIDGINWPEAGIYIQVIECDATMDNILKIAKLPFVKYISPDAVATVPSPPDKQSDIAI